MFELTPNLNTGCLGIKDDPNIWIAGSTSKIVRPINLPSRDWTPYAPTPEIQYNPQHYFDTQNCTAFGYTDSSEPQFTYLIQNNLIPAAALDFLTKNGYFDANGKINFSDRFLGIISGTGPNGNYLNVVAEVARTKGLIPESMLPFDFDKEVTLAEYYDQSVVTPEMTALAKEFLNHFQLQYELTADTLDGSPSYVALCTCNGWNNPPVPWCGITQTNHAVALYRDQEIFDSYSPFLKQLSADYQIPYKLAVVVNPIKAETMKLIKVNGTIYRQSGVNNIKIVGIADQAVLDEQYGDEPIEDVATLPVPETFTEASGTIVHKK